MAQTREGAIKIFCKRIGITFEYYKSQVQEGLKWCTKCKNWVSASCFNVDNSRHDNLTSKCHACTRTKERVCTKGRAGFNKGRKFTGMALENIRRASKESGLKRIGTTKTYTKEGYQNLLNAIRKPRPSIQGKNNYNWKDGSSERHKDDRRSFSYVNWRRQVFERDNYTCQDCSDSKGGNLEAHHLKEYSQFPELRYEVGNGLTLCKTCHEKRHFKRNSTRNIKKIKKGKSLKF